MKRSLAIIQTVLKYDILHNYTTYFDLVVAPSLSERSQCQRGKLGLYAIGIRLRDCCSLIRYQNYLS